MIISISAWHNSWIVYYIFRTFDYLYHYCFIIIKLFLFCFFRLTVTTVVFCASKWRSDHYRTFYLRRTISNGCRVFHRDDDDGTKYVCLLPAYRPFALPIVRSVYASIISPTVSLHLSEFPLHPTEWLIPGQEWGFIGCSSPGARATSRHPGRVSRRHFKLTRGSRQNNDRRQSVTGRLKLTLKSPFSIRCTLKAYRTGYTLAHWINGYIFKSKLVNLVCNSPNHMHIIIVSYTVYCSQLDGCLCMSTHNIFQWWSIAFISNVSSCTFKLKFCPLQKCSTDAKNRFEKEIVSLLQINLRPSLLRYLSGVCNSSIV